MMKTHGYSPRPRFVVAISSLVLLTLILAAWGASSTSGGSVTPTPGKMRTLQTSCPPEGTARAAIMTPLALGKQDTFIYLEGKQPPGPPPGSYTLKRYTVSTRTTTDIMSVPDTLLFESQISADGQWVMLSPNLPTHGYRAIQLVRMDGQMLQTLYCDRYLGWIQWSPDNKYMAFVDASDPNVNTWTFNLLNVATGTIQTKPHDSNHVLNYPLAWLDNTHLYVQAGPKPIVQGQESPKLSLLDITTGTSEPILSLPDHCFDATHSVDGTLLFTSLVAQCIPEWGASGSSKGPSGIQVQSATGGLAKTIYSTPTDAITALLAATNTSLLFFISNTDTDTSHNGLWKVNTDGTGLTRLTSEAAIIKDAAHEEMGFGLPFGLNMDQPWANISRDGAYYSIVVYNHGSGPSRLLIGSMNGGAPVMVASGTVEVPVGWTMM